MPTGVELPKRLISEPTSVIISMKIILWGKTKQVTRSEKICNEIGAKFFCKDFVYENLKYYNSENQRVELCDALFEYASIYVPLQIKERSKSKGKQEDAWLKEIVYDEAVRQIKTTIEAINNNNIVVNDLYHQTVKLKSGRLIFPVIVFDNPAITDYQRVIIDGNLKINVFKLEDYEAMMSAIMHPYDIIYYLQERVRWLGNSGLPHFIIGDGERSTILANIRSERDFATFFMQYIYEGKPNKQMQALQHLALIGKFRDNQIKKNPQYKRILEVLQLIEPKVADEFMGRFDYAWECACEDKFDFSKCVQVQYEGKKTSIVFFSVGRKAFANKEYYQVVADAKQLKQKADAVLLIVFVGDTLKCCNIDWFYYEKQYAPDAIVLEFYEKIGMFNGTMSFDIYEELCKKMLEGK